MRGGSARCTPPRCGPRAGSPTSPCAPWAATGADDLLAALLAELRAGGPFRSALLWVAAAARPGLVDGEAAPDGLGEELARARALSDRPAVARLGAARPAPGAVTGLAGPATGSGDRLVLLAEEHLDDAHEHLFADLLEDATTLLVAAG